MAALEMDMESMWLWLWTVPQTFCGLIMRNEVILTNYFNGLTCVCFSNDQYMSDEWHVLCRILLQMTNLSCIDLQRVQMVITKSALFCVTHKKRPMAHM